MQSIFDRQSDAENATITRAENPPRPAWQLWMGAAAALLLAVLVSPKNLVAMGVGRRTFVELPPDHWMRVSVEAEFWLFRASCLGIALSLLVWSLFRDRLRASSVVGPILSYESGEVGWVRSRDSFFNLSLCLSLAFAAAGVAFLAFVEPLVTAEQWIFINEEDGVIEYATALMFLVASALAAVLAFRDRADKRRAAFLALLALACFFVCGEEISWGQRIFDLDTLEVFQKYNEQNENTLHNIFNATTHAVFLFAAFLYGVALPILTWRVRVLHNIFDWLKLPIASLGLSAGFLIMLSFDTQILARVVPMPTVYVVESHLIINELRELLIAVCFLLLLVEAWRKAPEDRPSATPAASA